MRNAFASEVTSIASRDERLVLLSGDIGNKLFDSFKDVAPSRFINCGIAEANMIGTAAGLAMSGLKPFVYTIAPFTTARCFEQIKLDVCYHNVPVIIVGVGAGLSYASLGATHHAFEDIAILRVLPRMTILCPGDAHEVRLAVNAAMSSDGPVYIRLGKKGEPLVHPTAPSFEIGKAIHVRQGKSVCILSTGNVLALAMECAAELEKQSIDANIVSFHTVKPMDEELLCEVFSKFPLIVTIEEHSLIGGLGSSVAEWKIKTNQPGGRLVCFGMEDSFLPKAGNQRHARNFFGLTQENIVAKISSILTKGKIGK